MRFLTILFALSLASPVAATDLRVIDGDGLMINGQSFRLWDIDAPERRQNCQQHNKDYPCGEVARAALVKLTDGQDVQCEALYRDRYKREIARCFVGEVDLGGEMVRLGLAIDWPKYSDGYYADQQQEAVTHERGLWGGEFIPPDKWRRR